MLTRCYWVLLVMWPALYKTRVVLKAVLIAKSPIICETSHVMVWNKNNISIMLGFNYQESHRVDFLWICRHCSCMPSCRRMLTSFLKYFGLSITNALLLIKYEYTVSKALCASGFEARLSAAAPAEQLPSFFEYKIMLLLRKLMLFLVW